MIARKTYGLPVLLIGLSIGIATSLSALTTDVLAAYIEAFRFLRIPYVLPVMAVGLAIACLSCYMRRDFLRSHRVHILTILFLLANQLSQLSALMKIADNLLAIALLGSLVADLLADREKKVQGTALNYLILVYVGAIVVSTLHGGMYNLFKLFTTVMKYLALFFVVANYFDTRDRLIFLLVAFLSVTVLSAVIGIAQETFYLTKGGLLMGNIPKSSQKMFFEDLAMFGRVLRVPAFFPSPQRFAETLMVCISGSLYFVFSRDFGGTGRRTLLVSAVVLLAAALSLTFVRAALLGLLAAILLLPLMKKPSWAVHYACIAVLAGIILYAVGVFDLDVAKSVMGHAEYRVNLMQSAVEGLLTEHPLLGVGIDQGYVYHPNIKNWPVHNAFVLTWVESGLIGFLAFCAIIALLLVRLLRATLCGGEGSARDIGRAVLLGFVALMIYINGDPSPHDTLNWMLFGVVESIARISGRERDAQAPG